VWYVSDQGRTQYFDQAHGEIGGYISSDIRQHYVKYLLHHVELITIFSLTFANTCRK
jgi:hypothetical protein